jgi:hypothetical protein
VRRFFTVFGFVVLLLLAAFGLYVLVGALLLPDDFLKEIS